MADSSLDEFFAKKDKTKKSKNKNKFMTSELGLATTKKSEDLKRTDKNLKKEKERGPGGGNQLNTVTVPVFENEPQEWKEQVEEQEKDYSGLRIQTLSLNDQKDDEQGRDQIPLEDGEEFRFSEGPQGPWKLSSASADSTIVPVEKEEEPEIKTEPTEVPSSKPQKYVPPSMRGGSALSTPSSNPYSSRRFGKSVPEMDSELHFPSLSAVSDSDRKGISDNDKSFQSVTRGYKTKDGSSQGGGVQLDLGNKFSALRQRDLN